NGSGFGATQGTSSVTFNGTTGAVVSWSDAQIVATVPSTGATAPPVVVTVGGVSSNSQSFLTGTLLVQSVSPSAGPVTTQGTVSGLGFGASPGTLSFNNTAATSITSWSDTQIVAAVPTGATSGAVKVVSGGVPSNTTVSFAVSTVLVT